MTAAGVRATAASIASGARSAREVVDEALAAARAHEGLGALWFTDEDGAREAADAIDARLARGMGLGPLAGVPVVVKDAFHVRGMPGGGGGPVAVAERDAAVVRQLRAAGAVIIGKAAMHQLGWGMTGQTPGRPLCRNPRDPERQPGGSSSGSAAVVAAGIVPLALGGDTGGSVRQPAAWCDVVGWKPAQATTSRAGLDPLAPALDTVGWLTRSVDDAIYVHEALAGRPLGIADDAAGLSMALDPAVLERSDPAVATGTGRAVGLLEERGAVLRTAPMPGLPARLGPVYAADLAAFWADAAEREPALFGADVRDGIAAGLAVPAVDYIRCLADREAERRRPWRAAAVAIGPTSPALPPLLTEPDDVRRVGGLTRPYNLLDWPAISVPAPGAPGVGIQIAAPRSRMRDALRLARALEAAAGEAA